jgi:vancomycin resistance protein YoaR
MIAFRKDDHSADSEYKELLEDLYALFHESNLHTKHNQQIFHPQEEQLNLNFSEILDFIYHNLFIENKTSISLQISKDASNNLFVKFINQDDEF